MEEIELRANALALLIEADIERKARGVVELWQQHQHIALDAQAIFSQTLITAGRPARPELVPPQQVKRRALHTVEGRATLIHALTHIEFNAINLALDIIWRFARLPVEFYYNWLQVAAEEVYHFQLLSDHLIVLGYQYGEFPAHNGLWEMAERTSHDLIARLAMVPRTLEARGLDVTPGIRSKLAQAGDHQAAAILDIILRDEIGHVAYGNFWYHQQCQLAGLDAQVKYQQLCQQYHIPTASATLNRRARLQAGFAEEELTT